MIGVESQNETASPAPAVLSVEQLNRSIRQMIEGQIPTVWVRGEISNFKAHTSGHFYFSLKDSASQIRAVMFRGHNSRLKFRPTDGMEVIARAKVTVYEPRGEYQLSCEMMEPVGAGALQKAYEQLKEKLRMEGLFDSSRKRPLPVLPRHVAIVTSPTGAAIRDMMNVLSRRNKSVEITLIPTIVQGEGSAAQICRALEMAFRLPRVDAVIVGRGGGSIEDLWAFNDENLARLIARSPIPIISAVGHEVDFTIADFVADVRAPTPSAAAELVVKSSAELSQQLNQLQRLLRVGLQKKLGGHRQLLSQLHVRLRDPRRELQDQRIRNDELLSRLLQACRNRTLAWHSRVDLFRHRLKSPVESIASRREKLHLLNHKLQNVLEQKFSRGRFELARGVASLQALSPLRVLERGYAVAFQGERVLKKKEDVNVHEPLRIRLLEAEVEAQVVAVTERKSHGI